MNGLEGWKTAALWGCRHHRTHGLPGDQATLDQLHFERRGLPFSRLVLALNIHIVIMVVLLCRFSGFRPRRGVLLLDLLSLLLNLLDLRDLREYGG
jgi:hypothetical protein